MIPYLQEVSFISEEETKMAVSFLLEDNEDVRSKDEAAEVVFGDSQQVKNDC